MFDFLILTSKIFTINKPQVKVTSPSSPLQVPPVHQPPQSSDFILAINSVLTIGFLKAELATLRRHSSSFFFQEGTMVSTFMSLNIVGASRIL